MVVTEFYLHQTRDIFSESLTRNPIKMESKKKQGRKQNLQQTERRGKQHKHCSSFRQQRMKSSRLDFASASFP